MHGLLFTSDFLREGIRTTPGWDSAEADFLAFRAEIQRIFGALKAPDTLNEAQTEDEVIVPVLEALGWKGLITRQQVANSKGREDVPDFLLFPHAEAKANAAGKKSDAYRHGTAILEAKRWNRALDRGESADALDPGTPSSQMLRYLSRVETASDRAIKWGMLSNGKVWRLYWQDARSRAEEFLQFDLHSLSGVAGVIGDMFAATADVSDVHLLRAFFLMFRRKGFLPQLGDPDGRSFHLIALAEGRLWESKVSQDLGQRVFADLFPGLAAALVRHDPNAERPYSRDYLADVHRSALILLYRLLFVFYAEDRDLLPVHDKRYDDYSLRKLRQTIAQRVDQGDVFSTHAVRDWNNLRDLFRAIDKGDDSLGLPPYNGGLFHESPGAMLARTPLPDAELAPLLDGLSRRNELSGRAWINYRDLAVQHLGSIYERLLEQRLVETADGGVAVQPSTFARKNSGSYYTHDDLVKLILRETLAPLESQGIAAFDEAVEDARKNQGLRIEQRTNLIARHDPAEALLNLKICDPAMGSGHFLVSLVDHMADRILEQLADAPAKALAAGMPHYQSPVARDITMLRERILAQAERGRWTLDPGLLDDRHLVRRMILKRVVHGADKNEMAVELAKLALWLHTFTVGAPLSFLDHHLRCGDSLYGERLASFRRDFARLGHLFNDSQMAGLLQAAQMLGEINAINDIDLAEVERSRRLMDDAQGLLGGLSAAFDLWQALRWIAPLDVPKKLQGDKQKAATELLSTRYQRSLIEMLQGNARLLSDDQAIDEAVNALLDECRALAREERFLHWELAFPGVWPANGAAGGFDAIIGNPPWDRMKLQEVEWFAERRPQIALQARAADRKTLIAQLHKAGDPLAAEYEIAAQHAESAARIARDCGEYPLLSSGDINLYSLFVERAAHLVQQRGVVGLLTPSGIAGDKGAAAFFSSLSKTGRLGALFDFENKKVFFPDIHASFKFCALVFGGEARRFDSTRCAFYLHSVDELTPPALPEGIDPSERLRRTRLIELDAAAFAEVNPNTGTAPIFRNALDAELTTRIYRTHPVLVRRHMEERVKGKRTLQVEIAEPLYPVRYCTMFHMTNDSGSFRNVGWLDDNGGYRTAANRWQCGGETYLPLYEGKMVQNYDHRAASVIVNPENVHRPAQPLSTMPHQSADPAWLPEPQYWVASSNMREQLQGDWAIAFKDVTAPTNVRTMIAAVIPLSGVGNTLPLVLPDASTCTASSLAYLLANFNCLALDFCARQKVQGQHLNWYIVEQLPLIAPERFNESLGAGTVGDLVRREVLHLSYAAHDLASFARDLGHEGPPFAWDAEDRRHRMARLDALFFRLYGLNREEASYVLDTFPIVREQDERAFGRYRTKDLVLGYMNALDAGDIDSVLALHY